MTGPAQSITTLRNLLDPRRNLLGLLRNLLRPGAPCYGRPPLRAHLPPWHACRQAPKRPRFLCGVPPTVYTLAHHLPTVRQEHPPGWCATTPRSPSRGLHSCSTNSPSPSARACYVPALNNKGLRLMSAAEKHQMRWGRGSAGRDVGAGTTAPQGLTPETDHGSRLLGAVENRLKWVKNRRETRGKAVWCWKSLRFAPKGGGRDGRCAAPPSESYHGRTVSEGRPCATSP